jgi:hypothetical protein
MFVAAENSVAYGRRKFLGLCNHAFNLVERRHASRERTLFVFGREGGVEIGGIAVGEFPYGVDSGCFEELGKLTGHALDAEQIGVVDPRQDMTGGDFGLFSKLFAPFGACSGKQKVLDRVDADTAKFGYISGADALDFFDFVAHNSVVSESWRVDNISIENVRRIYLVRFSEIIAKFAVRITDSDYENNTE